MGIFLLLCFAGKLGLQPAVTCAGLNSVYAIASGEKYLYPIPQVRHSWGLADSEVVEVPCGVLELLPDGDDVIGRRGEGGGM